MSSATARAQNVQTLCATLPDPHVIEARTGAGHTASRGDVHHPTYPFEMSSGEIGCTLSHRACWQHILDTGAQYALIVEDDLSLDPAVWPHVLTLIHAHASPDHFHPHCPAKAREIAVLRTSRANGGPATLLPYQKSSDLQTVCQVVGRKRGPAICWMRRSSTGPPRRHVLADALGHGQTIHTILPNGWRIPQSLAGRPSKRKPAPAEADAGDQSRLLRRAVNDNGPAPLGRGFGRAQIGQHVSNSPNLAWRPR